MRNWTARENTGSKNDRPVKLTRTLMNQYRESLISRGCEQQTISMYFCYLNRLYQFLQGDRELSAENLNEWIQWLKDKGYSDRTINMHISSVNGFLRFCGNYKGPLSVISVPRNSEQPELSREEYLQLISYIKEYGSERDYLLTKTLGSIDITVKDLPCVTVEACRKGEAELEHNKKVTIPESLRRELFMYMTEHKLTEGPIFISNRGNPLDRANITHDMQRAGKAAGLDPEKCNPRALRSLYQRTQREITQHLTSLHMQEYDRLLEEENKKVS